ncbi:sensor histidine kinase [Reichenbachiella ulvae]|uniref:Histidine kinase n=1 Tax=Reichenbachiella ulvae TaxID=2980104 RepID=A0ABT3CTR6_9BACT|nr:histidine kinase [Reichenbachiella ulvae]MCV9387086.1 histidine kinase [Reichenbachiella ulvae]
MNDQSLNMPSYLGFLRNPIVQHVLFWTIYFAFNWIRWGSFFDDYVYSFKSNLVEFPLHIALVYFTVYFLMPRLLPEKIGWFIVALIGVTLFISYIKIIITFFAVTTDIYKEANRTDIGLFDFVYVADVFIGELYVVAVAVSVKITIDWISAKNRTNELEKTNLETELAFLKSQIQPHFFFNTLNNLYSLTLDKSEKAPYTVLKLSELMSYVIYDAKQKRVPLINEIQHIQNYLDLEMLRYGERLEVDLQISGDIEGHIIPPVLLLPFIENSFKHGTKVDSDTIPITISLDVTDNILTFSTENLKPKHEEVDNGLENYKHGVGMANTRRRLNLVYGEKHQLDIEESDDKYKIILKIPIE